MNAKQRLVEDTRKNVAHAADMLLYDARSLKRQATETDSIALTFAVEQRLAALRKTVDVLADQLAALKLLEKL